MRSYLQKGGFLVIDDFFDIRGGFFQWSNFEASDEAPLPRATPWSRWTSPTSRSSTTSSIWKIIDFSDPRLRHPRTPGIYGIFEDNDPDEVAS